MISKIKRILLAIYVFANVILLNINTTFADIVIEEGDVTGVARQGIKLFFG